MNFLRKRISNVLYFKCCQIHKQPHVTQQLVPGGRSIFSKFQSGMDDSRKFDKNGSSINRATFDQQSDEADADSGNDLHQASKCLYQNTFQRLSIRPELAHYETLYPGYIENLEKSYKQTIADFESEDNVLPSFSEIRNQNKRNHTSNETRPRYQDQPGVASCSSSFPDFSQQLNDNTEPGFASCSSSYPDFSQHMIENTDPDVASCSRHHDFRQQLIHKSDDLPQKSSLDQAKQPVLSPSKEGPEELTKEERKFVKIFRARRRELTINQNRLFLDLKKMYGENIKFSWISAFETFKLNTGTTRQLIPMFKRWLEMTENARKTKETQQSDKLNRE